MPFNYNAPIRPHFDEKDSSNYEYDWSTQKGQKLFVYDYLKTLRFQRPSSFSENAIGYVFFDSVSQKIVKSISFKNFNLNPYKKYVAGKPKIEGNPSGDYCVANIFLDSNLYEIKNINTESIQWSSAKQNKRLYGKPAYIKLKIYSSYSVDYYYAAISYTCLLYSEYEDPIGTQSIVITYNNKGEKQKEYVFPDLIRSLDITQNGEFLIYSTIGLVDKISNVIHGDKIKIVHLPTMTTIHTEDNYRIGWVLNKNTIFISKTINDYKTERFNIFHLNDSNNIMVYSKDFDRNKFTPRFINGKLVHTEEIENEISWKLKEELDYKKEFSQRKINLQDHENK
jgi:hypothetical protein